MKAAPAMNSPIMKRPTKTPGSIEDLKRVKNVKPMWSKLGLVGGVALGALDMWLNTLFGFGLGTWKHGKPDSATLKPAADSRIINYPKPDGVLSFDRLTNLAFSATNHEEDEPVHLKLEGPERSDCGQPADVGRARPALLSGRRLRSDRGGRKPPRFQINHQNCVHCKTCDIKDPSQNINWVVPQGGEGPNYPNM